MPIRWIKKTLFGVQRPENARAEPRAPDADYASSVEPTLPDQRPEREQIQAPSWHQYATQKSESTEVDATMPENPGALMLRVEPPMPTMRRKVVTKEDTNGTPSFKYRFQARLEFDTPSKALRQHRKEKFIKRPNGNRDHIEEPGGWWQPLSEYDSPEWTHHHEDERFKYIGGVQVYIDFLMSVRKVYESQEVPPAEKQREIERLCLEKHDVYTVRHQHSPPWVALLVPALSIGTGIGPSRAGILGAAGVKSIGDVRARSDKELLEIKGIGKAALAALRDLAAGWRYDVDTEVIERHPEYRKETLKA